MRGLIARLLGRNGPRVSPDDLPVEGVMPELRGITGWINSPPLSKDDLMGKVVLVDFWTYSCINCIRTLPFVNALHERYAGKGLVVLGIHSPEFDFEKDPGNVEAAVRRYGIRYPVALDNDYAMWRAYGNRYWPSHYFIDREGRIRYHRFGEGAYAHSEAVIRTLLRESGTDVPEHEGGRRDDGGGPTGPLSPETYLGHRRLEYLGSPEPVAADRVGRYSSVARPARNIFYLEGEWELRDDHAIPRSPDARIMYRYGASSVNLVMDGGGAPHRIDVLLDGSPVPAALAGNDVRDGTVTATDGRLYAIIDARGDYGEHTLQLVFKDPGVKAYAFTFG